MISRILWRFLLKVHEIFWSVFPLDPVLGQGAVPEANESESHICNEHPLISQVVFFQRAILVPSLL